MTPKSHYAAQLERNRGWLPEALMRSCRPALSNSSLRWFANNGEHEYAACVPLDNEAVKTAYALTSAPMIQVPLDLPGMQELEMRAADLPDPAAVEQAVFGCR